MMQPCAANTTEALSPCTLVIFGASGDLTTRKLMPALHGLFRANRLPQPFHIVGCARTQLDAEAFRCLLHEAMSNATPETPEGWDKFAKHISYIPLQYSDAQSFTDLATGLRQLDRDHKTQGNRIFYLATPPTLYPLLAAEIGRTGLAAAGLEGNGWVRIVVEKPFGRDLKSALELDLILHQSFQEHQIFRIDHYLAKETVQNILMLRFANTIFEPLWNRSYIDYIGIMAAEQLGVEHRAGYYEQTGILRDMFQNHMQQLLALTAMEPPSLFEAERVRDEKAKCSRALKPLARETLAKNLIIGQYGPGTSNGQQVAGYRNEPGVDPNSRTPTFAMMRLFVDNWRWRDVPFYLISGKRLARKETKIVVQFKPVPHSMFRDMLDERITANRLTLGIHPDEEITITFQTKTPGPRVCLRPMTMDFKYNQDSAEPALDAYAKVVLDVIQGDHMLFWRQDGVELAWSFLTPILEDCEACGDRAPQLHTYPAGSWGPEAAQEWMRLILNN